MSQPLPPPVPDWAGATPEWTPPTAWTPPTPAVPPPAAAPTRSKGPLVLGLVALAGLAAGAVGAAFLVTAVFLGSAQDIGREMGEGIGESLGDGLVRSMEEAYGFVDEDYSSWGAEMPVPPEELATPVAPTPGPDPVLDAYAQSCFEGDYQSCDDLYYESPPLSDYEQYGGTCGGRVKLNTVMACTDLE